jgi:galactosamine-6-phosphate isomerase
MLKNPATPVGRQEAHLNTILVQTTPTTGSLRACEFFDHEVMSRHAACLIIDEVRHRPDLLLCVAAGSTPIRTYQILAEQGQTEPHLFNDVRVLKLDEWGGLEMDHQATCESYLQRYLIHPLGLSSERYISFRSNAADPQAECERVWSDLAKHLPIDYCILGLGTNGHLGLNEPAESLRPFLHVATLAESSLRHPMVESVNRPVTYGLTLGMAEIMQSRKILLLVSGVHKRRQLRRLLRPHISSQFPASFLWLHPDVTLLCDRDSASGSGIEEEG